MPEVSIIIPNYNHAKFLQQRIDSILSQTFQNFELIILDDCSTDESRDIIRLYKNHSKISHIIFNEHNSGSTFKQWEKGITLATGKFIWIAESDDWCEPTLLEHLYDGINHNKDCSISYCQSYCVDVNNNIKWISQHNQLADTIDGRIFIQDKLLYGNSIFNASMAIWRKDLFKKITHEFTTFKFCGDWLFWIELAALGNVHVSGRILNYFRKHQDDVSNKFYNSGLNFIEELKVIDLMLNRKHISEQEYKNAYKQKNRAYKKVRLKFNSEIRTIIDHGFNNSLTGRTSLFKTIASYFGI